MRDSLGGCVVDEQIVAKGIEGDEHVERLTSRGGEREPVEMPLLYPAMISFIVVLYIRHFRKDVKIYFVRRDDFLAFTNYKFVA